MIDPRTPERVFEECEAKRKSQLDHSLRLMCQMDDLGEALALAAEAVLTDDNMARATGLEKAVAAWRAFRPTKGLVAGGAV